MPILHPPLRTGIATLALAALAALAAFAGLAGTGAAAAEASRPVGAALAKDKGCFRCHDGVRHFVGPAFTQVADRYRDDATAAERLAGRIRQGSVGEWGRVIMPRQPQVTAADAAVLADWVLSQRSAR